MRLFRGRTRRETARSAQEWELYKMRALAEAVNDHDNATGTCLDCGLEIRLSSRLVTRTISGTTSGRKRVTRSRRSTSTARFCSTQRRAHDLGGTSGPRRRHDSRGPRCVHRSLYL